MVDEWSEELQRFHERTAKRRAKAKEHDDEAQAVIREADERADRDKASE